ncbi:MAG: alpha-E domain-containing protein [Deltaproteobacteria bacterium]|nr:alpha-E domain-containing protein [Deltaproteobacteria bacterium]
MISRVAESCFWLHRYLERMENTARMLEVNHWFLMDIHLPRHERWRPVLIVAGEQPRFDAAFGTSASENGEDVQRYLTWDEECPVAIRTSLRGARENARTIRDTISHEMWEALNGLWIWAESSAARRLYEKDRTAFYAHVKESCQLFMGLCHNTMLHEEPFDFMRLGMLLERAGQTARILDVKHHQLGNGSSGHEGPADLAQWIAILRACSAYESFFRRSRGLVTGRAVAEFLLLEPAFPRTVLHCLDRAWNFLRRIRPREPAHVGAHSAALLSRLLDSLKGRTMAELLEKDIHQELTRVIDDASAVCLAIHEDYFDPALPAAMGAP